MPTLEVCFTPELYKYKHTTENHSVIIVDVLRATTAMCSALHNGVKAIIPVSEIEDLKKFKKMGYLVASERDGIKPDFADFGNSPLTFINNKYKNEIIAYSTTNGTQAINIIKEEAETIYIGAYTNISILTNYLIKHNQNVVIVCSGWKQKFSLEDTIIAGAYCDFFINKIKYYSICDSSTAALDLWKIAKNNLLLYVEKCIHKNRLKILYLDDCIEYCFTADINPVIPKLNNGMIKNILINNL